MKTVKLNNNLPYYLIAAAIFILLKFAFNLATHDELLFLLQPTDKLVELMTGSRSEYNTQQGYLHEELNILVDKSCSGFNFWVLSFLTYTYLALKYYDKG